ncbi:hypothetical protein [Oceaniglobus ichthyenteri]|uniref:hypothetical protein n=1 Tax=Oceaniglobus ichthyenteri TaxID=2136177 RepID=UPI000D3B90ED|nr:hypothetical protein [Oceaniglobus ichthyenteri]
MYQELVEKARQNRKTALLETRMPQINLFWDGRPRTVPQHSVAAQLTDLRIRMSPPREALLASI